MRPPETQILLICSNFGTLNPLKLNLLRIYLQWHGQTVRRQSMYVDLLSWKNCVEWGGLVTRKYVTDTLFHILIENFVFVSVWTYRTNVCESKQMRINWVKRFELRRLWQQIFACVSLLRYTTEMFWYKKYFHFNCLTIAGSLLCTSEPSNDSDAIV